MPTAIRGAHLTILDVERAPEALIKTYSPGTGACSAGRRMLRAPSENTHFSVGAPCRFLNLRVLAALFVKFVNLNPGPSHSRKQDPVRSQATHTATLRRSYTYTYTEAASVTESVELYGSVYVCVEASTKSGEFDHVT